jgi:hypothetical protein
MPEHTVPVGEKRMSIDRMVLAFAGAMILLSLALSYLLTPWWLLLATFVGLNMLQAAFTGFCPLAMLLKKFGAKPGVAFS